MPLSARARIEVYLPDLLSLPSQELLIVFNQEFTHTFGGATLWRGLDGSYLAQNGQTMRDRINLLYTDTAFSLEENADELTGANVLGRLLVRLRGLLAERGPDGMRTVEPLAIPDFLLLGEPIRTV